MVLLAVLWAWRSVDRSQFGQRAARLAAGFALVVVPAYVIAGPHVLRQLKAAGGSFSYASPWSPALSD